MNLIVTVTILLITTVQIANSKLSPSSATLLIGDLQIPGGGHYETCNNHYQSSAYAISPKFPRVCVYGNVKQHGKCLNWVDCYMQMRTMILQHESIPFIGYNQFGYYPPTANDNYYGIDDGPTYNVTYNAHLVKCRRFSNRGYCYMHGPCSGVNHCLDQLSELVNSTDWYKVEENTVMGLLHRDD